MSAKKYILLDPETNEQFELEARAGTLGPRALDVRPLFGKAGLFTYDPGFGSTSSCTSKITYIDGQNGVLLYRGYPIEQLAEQSSFMEVCYLLLHGELPDPSQLDEFTHTVTTHTMINENILGLFRGFHYDAHPMAMLSGIMASMSAFYHDTTDIMNPRHRDIFAHRIIAKLPTIAAAAYKHTVGQPFAYPRNDLDYCSNLLHMFFSVPAEDYEINPIAAQALDLLFILHADHEQNCSTSTVRLAGSSHTNPYSSIASGISALWGPAHGGANEAVLAMLHEIGTPDRIPKFIDRAKDRNDNFRLMGFGHRVYKNYDPRAKIIRSMTHKVLEQMGKSDPLLDVAMKLEEIALKDEYFIEKRLYPNVDFYSGIIYKALGIPTSMFTVMFSIGRAVGWCAHWREMITDPEGRIGRPRQVYAGPAKRDYVTVDKR